METIYETYKRRLCKICKNKETELCHMTMNTEGNLQCCYYARGIKEKGYKEQKRMNVTANKNKTIMKGIEK